MFSSAWNLIDIIGKVAKYAGLGVSVANIANITENAMEQLAQNLAREAAKSEEQKSSADASDTAGTHQKLNLQIMRRAQRLLCLALRLSFPARS